MARSTSEMFALMDRVATSPRTAAPQAPVALTASRGELLADPLDLEHEPPEDPDFDELDDAYAEIDGAYAYDEAGVDSYEGQLPVRVPLYPEAPEDAYPSVGDPRIDAALRRARAD
jgi:hypothetical protein